MEDNVFKVVFAGQYEARALRLKTVHCCRRVMNGTPELHQRERGGAQLSSATRGDYAHSRLSTWSKMVLPGSFRKRTIDMGVC
jgi:hypothetical protein